MKNIEKTKAQLVAELEILRRRVAELEAVISQPEKADYEIQERRVYLEGVLTSAPDAIVTLDAQHLIVEWNPGAQKLFGYAPQEAIGRNLDDLITAPDVFEEAVGLTRAALGHKQTGPVEMIRYRKDGTPVHVILAGAPILVEGELIGLVAIYTDISERKQAEQALQQLNASLEAQVTARTAEIRAEKEKSEAILLSVGDAILVTDRHMCIHYVNPAFAALTGFSAKETLGQHAGSIGAGVDSGPVAQAIGSALAAGKTWQGEVTAQRKDGRTYDAALIITPLRDAAGRPHGYVSSHRDISHLKELDRARSRFMTNVSHELRTPVTNLKLYAQLMRKGLQPEKHANFLQVMEEQADRLAHLIQRILLMAELDSGLAVVDRKPVPIDMLVRNVATRYQNQADEADLRLAAEPAPLDLPIVKGDAHWLTRAVGELVENAIAFTKPGGWIRIEARTAEKDGQHWLTISVHDSGPGVSIEEQERIFERLYRGSLAASGHIPGSGLGLSIVQEIARAHGGRVTVESELGKGSTFALWLQGTPKTEN